MNFATSQVAVQSSGPAVVARLFRTNEARYPILEFGVVGFFETEDWIYNRFGDLPVISVALAEAAEVCSVIRRCRLPMVRMGTYLSLPWAGQMSFKEFKPSALAAVVLFEASNAVSLRSSSCEKSTSGRVPSGSSAIVGMSQVTGGQLS